MYSYTQVKNLGKLAIPDAILFRLSPVVVSVYSRIMTWYASGRHYEAPIKPMRLIEIDPNQVESRISSINFSYPLPVSEVASGNWDLNVKPLSEYDLYKGFIAHFEDNEEWVNTEFYKNRKEKIEEGEERWGCSSPEELLNRLKELDSLFESMQMNGYRTQRQLRTSEMNPRFRDIHRYWPPELHEVTVNIGREGEFILHDGRHRLIIAQILGIERIPVRVKTRHIRWQKFRDEIYTNSGDIESIQTHPDLLT